jgi:tetratricopeptide (TPR) repeat protein
VIAHRDAAGHCHLKIFVSYTSSDKDWAQWIGWNLRQAGHEPFLHDWEIGAGENIAGWMENRFHQADKLIGVFSEAYCKAAFSQSERWSAYWQDPQGRSGFFVPIEVRKVSEWPGFVSSLKHLSLVGLSEDDASQRLVAFLRPPQFPIEKPAFPGAASVAVPQLVSFADGGDPIGNAPVFPASPSVGVGSQAAIYPAPSPRCIDDHEPKPVIFGREDEIQTIVDALLDGKVSVVAGGPGMGKTALATAALYDPRVIARFSRRRVFASLETATEPRAILAKLVETLGLPPTGDEVSLLRILETNAAEQPLAAILDNAETVFDIDRANCERLLNLVSQVKGLSLTVTIRGVAPPMPNAVLLDNLSKLERDPARDAFLSVAGVSFVADPNLPHLLEALDGHALSIRLVAAQAIGLPTLDGLRESWDDAHAEILRVFGEEESRLTSVRASLALSLNSRRMKSTPLAKRLVALIAFLPSGLAEGDVRILLGERGSLTKAKANEAVTCLHQLRLVERRPDLRLRMLTPLRECVRSDVSPLDVDRKRLVDHFLALSVHANMIATQEWEKYREKVEAEADNLDSVSEFAVATSLSHKRLEAALGGLIRFHIQTGRSSLRSIDHAIVRLRTKGAWRMAAGCLLGLANVGYAHSDYVRALARVEDALMLYRRISDAIGEANCIRQIGEIAAARNDRDTARMRFGESLVLYREYGEVLGEANSMQSLGEIEYARSNLESAAELFKRALGLHSGIGRALGNANGILSLGWVAQARLECGIANTHAEEALKLYRAMGATPGEANSLTLMGDTSWTRLDFEAAQAYFEQALALNRRIGIVRNEAICLTKLGVVAYSCSDYECARKHFEVAALLHRRIGNALGEAWPAIFLGLIRQKFGETTQGRADIRLGFALLFGIIDPEDRAQLGWRAMESALTALDPAEAVRQRNVARSAWTAIGRLDFVHDWVDRA